MILDEFMTIAGQRVPASRIRHHLLLRLTRQGFRRSADGKRVFYRGKEIDAAKFRTHVKGCAVGILRGNAHRQERAGMRREAKDYHRQANALQSPEGAVWARVMAAHLRPALQVEQEAADV